MWTAHAGSIYLIICNWFVYCFFFGLYFKKKNDKIMQKHDQEWLLAALEMEMNVEV